MAYLGYSLGLKDEAGRVEAGAKDLGRMMDVVDKAGGDLGKMLQLCEVMAARITKLDKALRRAEAARLILPAPIAEAAAEVFLRGWKRGDIKRAMKGR